MLLKKKLIQILILRTLGRQLTVVVYYRGVLAVAHWAERMGILVCFEKLLINSRRFVEYKIRLFRHFLYFSLERNWF